VFPLPIEGSSEPSPLLPPTVEVGEEEEEVKVERRLDMVPVDMRLGRAVLCISTNGEEEAGREYATMS